MQVVITVAVSYEDVSLVIHRQRSIAPNWLLEALYFLFFSVLIPLGNGIQVPSSHQLMSYDLPLLSLPQQTNSSLKESGNSTKLQYQLII